MALPPRTEWGYIDKTGNWVIEPKYYHTESFKNGFARIHNGSELVYIDASGQEVSGPSYEDGKWVWQCPTIDENGKIFFSSEYEFAIKEFRYNPYGLMMVQDAQFRTGFVDKNGKLVVPTMFELASEYSEGLAKVTECTFEHSKGWGYIDTEGEYRIPPIYSEASDFSEGLAVVSTKLYGPYGFINQSGEFVLEPVYSNAHNFHEGLAAVVIDIPHENGEISRRWVYIDQSGKVVINKIFAGEPGDFYGGLAPAGRYVDKQWEEIVASGKY